MSVLDTFKKDVAAPAVLVLSAVFGVASGAYHEGMQEAHQQVLHDQQTDAMAIKSGVMENGGLWSSFNNAVRPAAAAMLSAPIQGMNNALQSDSPVTEVAETLATMPARIAGGFVGAYKKGL